MLLSYLKGKAGDVHQDGNIGVHRWTILLWSYFWYFKSMKIHCMKNRMFSLIRSFFLFFSTAVNLFLRSITLFWGTSIHLSTLWQRNHIQNISWNVKSTVCMKQLKANKSWWKEVDQELSYFLINQQQIGLFNAILYAVFWERFGMEKKNELRKW